MNVNSIVSVSKARRILGDLANNLSDNQIKEIIHSFHLLAREQLVYNGSNNDEYSNKPDNS